MYAVAMDDDDDYDDDNDDMLCVNVTSERQCRGRDTQVRQSRHLLVFTRHVTSQHRGNEKTVSADTGTH